jgi:hypothetical protein
VSPVWGGASVGARETPPAWPRLNDHARVAGALPPLFVGLPPRLPGGDGQGLAHGLLRDGLDDRDCDPRSREPRQRPTPPSRGGGLHARAVRPASCRPSRGRWPPGRGRSLHAAARPASTPCVRSRATGAVPRGRAWARASAARPASAWRHSGARVQRRAEPVPRVVRATHGARSSSVRVRRSGWAMAPACVCRPRPEQSHGINIAVGVHYGHLVLRLMGCLVLFYTSRVVCKGRLTMEEIIFSLKHYWRFVDSEVFELKTLSWG